MNLINYWKSYRESYQREQIEDTLKAIYNLQDLKAEISVAKLSELCALSLKRQDKVLRLLMQKGWIDPLYKLSPEGEKYALQIIRRHRLYEKHLSEHSGYLASEWHIRACKEEHKLSEEEQEEMSARLGNPLFDPHGDPIPSSDGEVLEIEGVGLDTIAANTYALIVHIEDEPIEQFKQLAEIGLYRDALVYLASKDKERLTIRFEGESFRLPLAICQLITVAECNDKERIEKSLIAKRLTSLEAGELAEVVGISRAMRGANRRRLLDLGFVRGSSVRVDLNSPLGNPRAYLVRGSSIALRRDQARYVIINKQENKSHRAGLEAKRIG